MNDTDMRLECVRLAISVVGALGDNRDKTVMEMAKLIYEWTAGRDNSTAKQYDPYRSGFQHYEGLGDFRK